MPEEFDTRDMDERATDREGEAPAEPRAKIDVLWPEWLGRSLALPNDPQGRGSPSAIPPGWDLSSDHFIRWCRFTQPPAIFCDPSGVGLDQDTALPHRHKLMRVVQRPAEHRQAVLLDEVHGGGSFVGCRGASEGELERPIHLGFVG